MRSISKYKSIHTFVTILGLALGTLSTPELHASSTIKPLTPDPLKGIKRKVTKMEIHLVIHEHTKDKIIRVVRRPQNNNINCSHVTTVNKKTGLIRVFSVGCSKNSTKIASQH